MMEQKPRMKFHNIYTFYGAYEAYKSEIMTYGGHSWNQNTTRQYDAIVLTHIVPYLKNHDQRHIGQMPAEEFDEALSQLKKRGKNQPGEPFEPWDEDGVPEKVDYLMRAIVWAASNHNLCVNLFGEKEMTRTGGGGGKKTGSEQVRIKKSLSIKQEILVVKYLMKRIYKQNPYSGLLLMLAEGLRNNEATGVNFGYIREFEEHPGHYYLIVPQTTDLGSSTLKILGKTANSGRKVPLPKLVAKILLRLWDIRAKEAVALGYTENVDDLPIVCKKGAPWKRCSSDDLSRAAKEMFGAIGMREDEIVELNQELLEEAQAARDEMDEDEFREIESDPTAYLLRRNFATHIAILGLVDVEIWYVIGHKIEDENVKRRAFNDEKKLFPLKRKLDERPILNDVIMEQVLRLEPGITTKLNGSRKLILKIPADQIAKSQISLTAKEPGEEIRMRVRGELTNGSVHSEFSAHNESLPKTPDRTIDGTRLYWEKYRNAGADGVMTKDIFEIPS